MTAWVQQWVTSDGLVDTIVLITLLETASLLLFHHQTKRNLPPRDYLLNVLSGLCLMLALRCALSGAAWYFVSLWLMEAGVAHVDNIVMQLQQSARAAQIKQPS